MNPLDLETISKDLACIIKGMPIVPENDSNLNPGNAILLVIFLREIFKDQSFNKIEVFNSKKSTEEMIKDLKKHISKFHDVKIEEIDIKISMSL